MKKKRCSFVEVDVTQHLVRVYRRCTRRENHSGVHAWGPWRKKYWGGGTGDEVARIVKHVRDTFCDSCACTEGHLCSTCSRLGTLAVKVRKEILAIQKAKRVDIKALLKNPKTRKQILDGAVDFICKMEGIRT